MVHINSNVSGSASVTIEVFGGPIITSFLCVPVNSTKSLYRLEARAHSASGDSQPFVYRYSQIDSQSTEVVLSSYSFDSASKGAFNALRSFVYLEHFSVFQCL